MREEYQRAIALISVPWITTLLAVIAASFTPSARTEGQLARSMVENAQAGARGVKRSGQVDAGASEGA